ncbi:MAG: DUF2314 domain-containing protein [Verrucomicrobiae bacterium]|nr:DUF2314 domain-containing protein [Verrucomicrobiae bacterium]
MFAIYLKRLFGGIAFLVGLCLMGWFIYNQFWPTEEFKRGFRSVFQLIVPISCLVVGWKWMRYKGRGIEQVIPPDLKCPELETAAAKARKTLGEFVTEVERGIDGAFIKFPLHTPQGMIEHIWAYVHFYKEGRFNVTLANEPIDDQAESEGRRDVDAEDVEDWQIMEPDGSIRGAYSLTALFQYWEGQGNSLSPLMREQKSKLRSAS